MCMQMAAAMWEEDTVAKVAMLTHTGLCLGPFGE